MDGQMIPSDINVDDGEMTPLECFETCAHSDACAAQLERLRGNLGDGETYSAERIARDLGCGECEHLEGDDAPALRKVCKQLIETVRVGEAMSGCALMAHYLRAKLTALGFEV